MKKKRENNKPSSWYFYNWTFLGWLETGVKAVALIIGIRTFYLSRVLQIWMIPSGIQLIQWIFLGILSLGILAAIYNRLQNKEII